MAVLYLTESDKKILQQVIDAVKNGRVNLEGRGTQSKTVGEGIDQQTSDVYICITPSGGIPGLSGDTPGTATCDIYRLGTDGSLEAIPDFDRLVYNLSESDLVGTGYIPTVRSKAGFWLAGHTAGSASGVGQADAAIAAGATGTVSIYFWSGTTFTDTLTNEEMLNTSGVTIALDNKVSWIFHDRSDQFLCSPLECP